jgi:hypothetical protein
MKNLNQAFILVLSAIALESGAFASSDNLVINGSRDQFQLTLDSEETHTLYDQREVPDVCYRTEQVGYRSVYETIYRQECSIQNVTRTRNEQVCRPGAAEGAAEVCITTPISRTNPERVCRNVAHVVERRVPNYEQVAYGCTRIETYAVGEELDYLVTAHVDVTVNPLPEGSRANEVLSANLSGSTHTLRSLSSSGSILLFVNSQVSSQIISAKVGTRAGQKLVTANHVIQPVAARDVKSPLSGISNMRLDRGVLKFVTGKVVLPQYLSIALDISKRRNLIGRKDLFKGVLARANYRLQSLGDRTEVSVDLGQLANNAEMRSGKVRFEITVGSDASDLGTLLNPQVMGATTVQNTLDVKLK